MKEIHLINFTQCSSDELAMILEWRNAKQIQKWMLNDADIKLSSHLAFVNSLNESSNKLYFLIKEEKAYLGVVDFTDITQESSHIGLYKNPNLYGVGEKLMQVICDYATKTLHLRKLYAEVFVQNQKAIELYKKFGFTQVNLRVIDTKELLTMEYKI